MTTPVKNNTPRPPPPPAAAPPVKKPAVAAKKPVAAKPAAAPAAAPPAAPAQPAQPPAKQGGSGPSLFDRFRAAVSPPPPTAAQRAALQNVRGMLEPDRLGGADRTFNYADRDAVVGGLMRDTNGLSQEVQARLRAEGHPFQANQARRGLEGRRGIFPQIARNKIAREAPGQIAGQVTQGLQTAGVDPNTGAQRDTTPRNLTFAQMREFEANGRVLQEMQRATEDRLNVDIAFPNGPSQAAIDFILEGRIGIPPGAVVTPRTRR